MTVIFMKIVGRSVELMTVKGMTVILKILILNTGTVIIVMRVMRVMSVILY